MARIGPSGNERRGRKTAEDNGESTSDEAEDEFASDRSASAEPEQDIESDSVPDESGESSDSSGGSSSSPKGGLNDNQRQQLREQRQKAESSTNSSSTQESESAEQAGIGVTVTENGGDISNAISPSQLDKINRQTPGQVKADDLRLVDGELQFSKEFKAQSARGTSGPTNRQTRQAVGEEIATTRLKKQLEEQTGEDVDRSDFSVRETEEGYEASLNDPAEQTNRKTGQPDQAGRRDGDIFSGVVSGVEGGLSEVGQVASGKEATRVEIQGQGSVANVAAQEETDLTADLGGVSDFGDSASELGAKIQQDYIAPTADVVGPTLGQSLTGNFASPRSSQATAQTAFDISSRVASARGDEKGAETLSQAETDIEKGTPGLRTQNRFGEGVASGGLGIVNAPAIAGTVVDATEFTVEGGSRTVDGEGDEFAKQAGGQATLKAAQATEFAASNPAKFGGQVVGGVAVSGGLIKGATALGGARAGRAASFGVQPGEELALTAARRGVPGAQRVAGAVGDVEVKGGNSKGILSDTRGTGKPPSLRFRRSTDDADTQPELTAEDLNVGRQRGAGVSNDAGGTRGGRSGTNGGGFEGSRGTSGNRGTGSRTGRTSSDPRLRRAQERRKQAEEQQVTEGEARFGVEEDLTPLLRTEITTGAQEQTAQESLSVGAEATEPIGATSSRPDVTIRSDTNLRVGVEAGQETRTESKQELGQEVRTELDTRLETRSEARVETKAETRIRVGAEFRRETSTDIELDGDRRKKRGQKKRNSVGNEFDNPVAKPGQIDEISREISDTAEVDILEDF